MSWHAVGPVTKKKWGSQARRLVAITMANKGNDDGAGVYCSVGTLAREAEVSESTARRCLQEFEREGLIVWVGQRECANGHTNIYDMCLDVIAEKLEDIAVDAKKTGVTVKGVSRRNPQVLRQHRPATTKQTPVTVTPLAEKAPTPVTVTPKTTLEPIGSKEPKTHGTKKRPGTDYPPAFQAVWMKWPSKRRERSDKTKAFERWEKGRQRWGVGLIEAAVDRYLADPDVRKENYRYCCLAEVFMNGKLEAAVEAAHAAATGAGESRKVWSSEEQAWVLRPA